MLYDALAGEQGRRCPGTVTFRMQPACAQCPPCAPAALTGGIRYYDAQVDDARFAVTLAGTAFLYGAACISAVEVTPFIHEEPASPGCTADLEGDDDSSCAHA